MKEQNLDAVALYLKEIEKIEAPTLQENRGLLIRYKNGEEELFQEIYKRNLKLVIPLAKDFARKNNTDLLDTIQNGNLGLGNAIEKFEPEYNTAFSTYAVPWIKQSISRNHMNKEQQVRVSAKIYNDNKKISSFIKKYESKYGVKPTDEEIKKELKLTDYSIEKFKQSVNFEPISLDKTIKEDEETSFYEIIGDDVNNYEAVENRIDKNIFLQKIKRVLSPQEYYVIYYRYIADELKSVNEIRDEFFCSRQNIDLIENKALEKIKKVLSKESDKEISIKEVLKERLEPFSFSMYVFLFLLKKELTEEEYYIYYQINVLVKNINSINIISESTIENLYLSAKRKADNLYKLSELERFEIAKKTATRAQMFDVEPSFVEKNYMDVLNSYSNITYLEFINDNPEAINLLSYRQHQLLQRFFKHPVKYITEKDKKETEKEINLKLLGYKKNIFLPKTILYDTYHKNRQLFSERECKLFSLEHIDETDFNSYDFVEKIEQIYFSIYDRQGLYFNTDELKRIISENESEFTKEELEILKKEYGINAEKCSRKEMEQEFSLTESQLTGKIRTLKRKIIRLEYNLSLKRPDKNIYLPYLMDDSYSFKELNRSLAIKYLEGASYEELSKQTGIEQNKICNIVLDVIRNIDYYRYNIVIHFKVDNKIFDYLLNDYKNAFEKEIVKEYYKLHSTSDYISKKFKISTEKIKEITRKFRKKNEKYLFENIKLTEEDYREEVISHITDSILEERERIVIAFKYGIKCNYNPTGLMLSSNEIKERLNINQNIYAHIIAACKNKIKKRKAGLEVPLFGHIKKEELETILMDIHLPLTEEEKYILSRLKGLNGYEAIDKEDLAKELNISSSQLLRKYKLAILSIFKYKNNEKQGKVLYEEDIVPNLKYFTLFETKLIDLIYNKNKTFKEIENDMSLTKDQVQFYASEIKRKLACLLAGNPNVERFDYEYARSVINNNDLPFYGNKDVAIKCYELYTGESGMVGLSFPEIINKLNLNVGQTSVENAINKIKLAVCKYRIGYRKEIYFNEEEIALFYQKYYDKLNKDEKVKIRRRIVKNDNVFIHYRNHWFDSVNYIMLEKMQKLPFILEDATNYKIEEILTNKNLKLSKKTRKVLLMYIGKSEKDMMSGKELLKIFRILKPFYIKSLEENKIYQKSSF